MIRYSLGKKRKSPCNTLYYKDLIEFIGAPCRNRTSDLLITSQLLYQLS
jgi:hypothetical protein